MVDVESHATKRPSAEIDGVVLLPFAPTVVLVLLKLTRVFVLVLRSNR